MFFHRLANSHHLNNTIGWLVVDGKEIINQDAIKEKIVNFYKALFLESGVCRPLLNRLVFSALEYDVSYRLERCLWRIRCMRWSPILMGIQLPVLWVQDGSFPIMLGHFKGRCYKGISLFPCT